MDMTTSLVDHSFRKDVRRCFDKQTHAIPARWLYDRRGSELFEEITELPEYYPTRTETELLKDNGAAFAASTGAGRAVIEFGSGSSVKTPHLLKAIDPAAYVPIDISGEFLEHSASLLQEEFPDLPIYPVEADFMTRVDLPEAVADMPKLGFFPGSTIGNMIARTSVDLLRFMRETLGDGAQLLIGFDRIKDIQTLIEAYDDAAGVTAQFSLNLLHRINRELEGDIPVEQFRHKAVWNDLYARIEIFLEAQTNVQFSINGHSYDMAGGQKIHIENSHKYGLRDARLMLRAGGWTPLHEWSDAQDHFTLMLVEAHPLKHAP
ncbi:L-histidine N(alpha)-methyltransferase [Sphingorhabdus sp. SMR4y]|uniref:L-histidine N(alpha)-methyltransferase n=1 Tax=Sphingorhabdus sp. SMR4y TaxID=2584094 RepID=UPI000B5C54FC|nr:L-histidine N(alpha)-methyltransferase [Sphingorhabdus sp. SMR4y]ASK88596.1 histidine N-alpha-methyltransferase [Sphingorhabdus sp. SMR4y]